MAPLTGFRRWLSPPALLRVNAWMLMTGSLGMVAATLPVQWLLPLTGWRGLFWGLAVLMVLAMAVIWRWVPDGHGTSNTESAPSGPAIGYRDIARHPFFWQMAPIGFVNHGGMVAVQTLWAGPWMVQVAVVQALPPQAVGRALSADNLVIFAGIFCVQWAIGLAVDGLGALGWDTVSSYQGAVALLGLGCLAAYGTFLRHHCRSLPIRPPTTRLN